MAVVKWTATDGVTTMTFEYNPFTMSSLFSPKQISVSTAQNLVSLQPAPAFEWTFEGNVYNNAEYIKLVTWHNKSVILDLTDHLGRTWKVVSVKLDIADRRDTAKNDERYAYTWTVLNLGRVEETS